MSYLAKAIKSLHPEAEFSFSNDDYSTINWDVLDGTPPTLQDIEIAIDKIKNDEAKAETEKLAAKAILLNKLGITDDEAKLLLG
jgi:hypothetical protein